MAAVSGDKKLLAVMTAVPVATLHKLDPAIKDALEPTRQQTKTNAMRVRRPGPRIGGHLDQGVVTKKISTGGISGVREFWVSLQRRARKIGHLVEFGTAPHYQPRRKRMHPGARAKPFMTPAFEATKTEAARRIATSTWQIISSAVRGLGGGR